MTSRKFMHIYSSARAFIDRKIYEHKGRVFARRFAKTMKGINSGLGAFGDALNTFTGTLNNFAILISSFSKELKKYEDKRGENEKK